MVTHELWKERGKLRIRAQKEGELWFKKLRGKLKDLPDGTLVAINVSTGEFVTATNQNTLIANFKKRFGNSTGWVREIHGTHS